MCSHVFIFSVTRHGNQVRAPIVYCVYILCWYSQTSWGCGSAPIVNCVSTVLVFTNILVLWKGSHCLLCLCCAGIHKHCGAVEGLPLSVVSIYCAGIHEHCGVVKGLPLSIVSLYCAGIHKHCSAVEGLPLSIVSILGWKSQTSWCCGRLRYSYILC